MILLSGTSNEPLALSIAKFLKISLAKREITRFIDNECRVRIGQKVSDQYVYVIQSLSAVADQHLVELCLIGQALKTLKARHVTAITPWMGYSKQDKAFRKGEAVSAQLVAKFIESAGFDHVITCELHSENLIPFFHIPVTELSTHTLLAHALGDVTDGAKIVVVSPDKGGKSRSSRFAQTLSLPIIYLEKERDRTNGKVTVTGISDDVKNKDVIIFDDIINTGSTAIRTSQFLVNKGARKIYFLATHGVLAGDAPKMLEASPISRVLVTDTIFIPKEKQFPRLTIISVAPLLANAIKQ